MNNDKRLFALLSLWLFLSACLAPFIIALLGRDDLAVLFVVVAGLLALLFSAYSWSEPIGRTVAALILTVLVVGGGASAVIYALRSQSPAVSLHQPDAEAPRPH